MTSEEHTTLNDDEFACLVLQSSGVSAVSAALGADHFQFCRFCKGKLDIARNRGQNDAD